MVPVMQCFIFSTIPYAPCPRRPSVSKSSASTSKTLSPIVMFVRLSKSRGADTEGAVSATMLNLGRFFLTLFPVKISKLLT